MIPKLYVGHKGEQIDVRVFRNGQPMLDSELADAVDLEFRFRNLTTGESVVITSGIWISPGAKIVYTPESGDGVAETPGWWEGQARGRTAPAGIPFRSEKTRFKVYTPVP